jgi:hypothetical protein
MPVCLIRNRKQHEVTGIKYNFADAGTEINHKDVSKDVLIYYVIRLHDSRKASGESPDYSCQLALYVSSRDGIVTLSRVSLLP